eukprot:4028917-Prorocentrum_lima.AAC.1
MTSSLVGSEMCIRDSAWLVGCLLACLLACLLREESGYKARGFAQSPSTCLLYTSDAADDM